MVAQDLAKVSQVPSLEEEAPLTPTAALVPDILVEGLDEGKSRPLHLCLTR